MIILNKKKVIVNEFPNGESLIKLEDLDIKGDNNIQVKFENDKDIVHLIFLMKEMESKGCSSTLHIPYLPYSRMDRSEGSTVFTLKHLSSIINSLHFKKVIIDEAHSDVSLALFDRVEVRNITQELVSYIMHQHKFDAEANHIIVYPDAGAEKRYSKQIKWKKTISCTKSRDFETGTISKIEINVNDEMKNNLKGATVIIADDLCSRGGTFIGTAKILKEAYSVAEIYLAVTHCENTIFEGDIFKTQYIDKVFTTDSILNTESELAQEYINNQRLNVIKVIKGDN